MKSSSAADATERFTYVLFPSEATSTTAGSLAARRAPASTVVALRSRRAAMTQSFHAPCCAKWAQMAGGDRLLREEWFIEEFMCCPDLMADFGAASGLSAGVGSAPGLPI